jgi:murein DD-endopeptidase MepM/ murein hydrolase activator NlpD
MQTIIKMALVLLLLVPIEGEKREWGNRVDHICPLPYCYRFDDRGFSSNHKAVDLNSPIGRDVVSSCYGKVVVAGIDPETGYAKRIIIDCFYGTRTGYWHLDTTDTYGEDFVLQGEKIGTVGQTGWSDWPHLHFSIIDNGKFVDPEDYIGINSIDKRLTEYLNG